MYIHSPLYMYVCIYIFIFIYIYIHTYTHTQIYLPVALVPVKVQRYPLNMRMDAPQRGFRGFGEENKFTLPDTESVVLDCPARSLVSITTNLSFLVFHFEFRRRRFCVGFVMNKLSLVCCLFCQCFLYHGHHNRINVSYHPFDYPRYNIIAVTDGVTNLKFGTRPLKGTKENRHVICITLFPHVWLRGCLNKKRYSPPSPLGSHSLWNWLLSWNAPHANYADQGGNHRDWNVVWSDGYTSGNNPYIENWWVKEVDTTGSS
jgi:hypothetical protein